MKKLLCVIIVLLLLAAGLFLWKGGHHALALAQILNEYLDIDDAAQSVTVLMQIPGARVDPETDQVQPHVAQYRFDCETFLTEYADRPFLGLTAVGASAYTDGRILYMDTGKAYTLPELSGLRKSARKLTVGMLLKGRVTKHGDVYAVSVEDDGWKLHADFTVDSSLRSVTANVVLPGDAAVTVSITPAAPVPHPIPQPVLDAMVRAKMEPPVPLTEPLQMLLPALDNLLPLQGDLTLGVECGILDLSESAVLHMDGETVRLERNGVTTELTLPGGASNVNPAALALLLLRNGSFIREGNIGRFDISIPADTTNALCTALVPQLSDLGIRFGESRSVLTIEDAAIRSVVMTAGGEVPFLITTIPVAFRAELLIP